jgi:hypothetical protein
MKKNKVENLIQRFLSAKKQGKEIYFDADEIDEMLEGLELSDDYIQHYSDLLDLGLQLHPGNMSLRIRQCKMYVFDENYKEALEAINQLGNIEDLEIELFRMECFCALGEYTKVVCYMDMLIEERSPDLEEAFEYLAPIINDTLTESEALEFIQRGLRFFPNNSILKDELCILQEGFGEIEEAIELCHELINKAPTSLDHWFTLGRLYAKIGEYERAIDAFDFALACEEDDVEISILKAYCLHMIGKENNAIEIYNEILTADKDLAKRVNPLIAECYIEQGKTNEAYNLLKEHLDQDAEKIDVSVYISLIRVCIELDKTKEAMDALGKAIELFPDNIRLLSLLTVNKYNNKYNNEDLPIEELADAFLQVMDEEEDITNELLSIHRVGQSLYLNGEVDKALKCFKKILEVSPKAPHVHFEIAMIYLSKGDIEKFNEYYQQSSPYDLAEYIKSGITLDDLQRNITKRPASSMELAREYLRNKDNRN